MNYKEAISSIREGKKVRLPEWRGYWFSPLGTTYIKALTKNGDIEDAWASGYKDRLDWEVAEGLDFGWAICALKAGKLVTRAGWNGKGMFLFIRPSDELSVDMIVNKVKSLPDSVKKHFNSTTSYGLPGLPANLEEAKVKFTSYICMKAADGTVVNGWLASQTDILAQDWELFEK